MQNVQQNDESERFEAKPTLLDQLTEEILVTSSSTATASDVTESVEKKVYAFLSEDSIIKRTKDCKSYFTNYVSAQAMSNKDKLVRYDMTSLLLM